jgi:hypothetical protein
VIGNAIKVARIATGDDEEEPGESQGPLQPGRVHRVPAHPREGRARLRPRQHVLRRAFEPLNQDGSAKVYEVDQRLFEEARKPLHALSLYFVFYNFVRIHKALKVTPAMQAGVTDRLWSMEDIVGLVDDLEVARPTGKRALALEKSA